MIVHRCQTVQQSAYQVDRTYRVQDQVIEIFEDKNNDVHDDDDTIAMIIQLVVLFQVKYKMRPFVHEDNDTIAGVHAEDSSSTDNNTELARNNYSYRMKLTQPEDSSSTDNNTEDRIDFFLNGDYYRVDRMYRAIAIMQIVLYQDIHDETRAVNGGNDTLNMNVRVFMYQDTYHTITIISSLGRNKILNGEYYFVLNIEISNTAEDLIDSFYKNDLTNKTGDQYNSNMSTINILLYQDVHDNAFMQRVLYQDVYDFDSNDDPIAIMQQYKEEYYSIYSNNLCTDDQRWYSTTTTNDDTIADVHEDVNTITIVQLVILYQINYKTIQPYHLKT